ncbi:MAG: hypothetical protein JW860_08200 [Sedimentisphaerales bacterium]|nr:hypothetical protein [Sedimentisphaerales bacterium]
MAECECLSGCPFFNGRMAQTMGAIVESMKNHYCLGDNANCARHMVFRSIGKSEVPSDLLPNECKRADKIIAEFLASSQA